MGERKGMIRVRSRAPLVGPELHPYTEAITWL